MLEEGKGMTIVDRIDAFVYLVGFLVTIAVPVKDPRRLEAMERF